MRQFIPLLLLPLLACPADDDATPPPIDVLINEVGEGLSPLHDMLPWPSDRWLVDDSSTVTGKRLQYDPAAMPLNFEGDAFEVDAYAYRDGFSPASPILTAFRPDLDVDATPGLAKQGEFEQSLAADSATILLDLETGERVPHWVELDARAHEDDSISFPAPGVVYLRPAANLESDRSYGVALRNVVLADGTTAEATPVFKALRDGTITTSASIEDRRPRYENLFGKLDEAGVDRADLVQAWTFHTASDDNLLRPLLGMRDDALERVGDGIGCTVTSVQEDVDDRTFRRVDGTFTIPLYMDSDDSPAHAVWGDDGVPEFQGWGEAPFTLLIPRSLAEPDAGPGRLLTFGHGLMGSAVGEGGGGYLRRLTQDLGMVSVATDWQGMSDSDLVAVGRALSNVGEFPAVGERLMQGMINFLVLTRTFKGACRTLPDLLVDGEPVIDDGEPYYLGISQGGIFGGTLMALSTDIARGALLVGGISYPMMIGRSVDFHEYELIYRVWYPRRIDREILMSVMSSMWDFSEPAPFMRHILRDPLPGTPPKQILYQVALHDSQVPNVASDMAARELGIPQLAPGLFDVWGVPTSDGPLDSAYVYYDTGGEPAPAGNNPPEFDNDAHGDQRHLDATVEQLDAFWRPDGRITDTCGGPCVFPQ